jgi:lysozyme family protein
MSPAEFVRLVQTRLARSGHYRGAIDADPGPQTVAAMERHFAGQAPAAPAPASAPLAVAAYGPGVEAEILALWDSARVTRPEVVEPAVTRALVGRHLYGSVGERAGGVPWWFVAALHMRESGFSFGAHLHNGDSLQGRTIRVPSGRPPGGQPPFGWPESAIDALTMPGKEFHRVAADGGWSIPRALWLAEAFNGLGYRRFRAMHSPYIWSATNHYTRGKYVADGRFSPVAVDAQPGVAALLLGLVAAGIDLAAPHPPIAPGDSLPPGGSRSVATAPSAPSAP